VIQVRSHQANTMEIEIKLPELGDGIKSGDILEVLVQVGDEVQRDQGVVEVETDKATVTLPSSQAGRVKVVHVKPGDTVPVGGRIVTLEQTVAAAEPAAPAAPPTPQPAPTPAPAPAPSPAPTRATAPAPVPPPTAAPSQPLKALTAPPPHPVSPSPRHLPPAPSPPAPRYGVSPAKSVSIWRP